jgi:CRP/FNR family transcriptional regulator, cyclic AMP receptor protein
MNPMIESLQTVPLFAELSSRDLKRLAASMKERSFAAGDEIVAQGKGGVGFFVILEGSARVSQDGEDRGRLGPGEYFGEMALIDGNLRLASVHAESDLRCATMSSWNFRPFVREHPDVAWGLLSALVKRVRDAQAQQVGAVG